MKPDFFYPKVRLHCPSVPTLIMDHFILSAVRKFCGASMAYVEYVSVPVTAGTARYNLNRYISTFDPDTETSKDEVFAVRSRHITFDDTDGNTSVLLPKREDEIYGGVANARGREGRPTAFYLDLTPHQIRLWPEPDADGTLQDVLVAKRPRKDVMSKDDDDVVPFEIYNNYEEIVTKAVVADLMRMPKKPWSNFTVGHRLFKEFNMEAKEARRDIRSSHVRSNLTVRLPDTT